MTHPNSYFSHAAGLNFCMLKTFPSMAESFKALISQTAFKPLLRLAVENKPISTGIAQVLVCTA